MNSKALARGVIARLDPYAAYVKAYEIFCGWLEDIGRRPNVYRAAIDAEVHRLPEWEANLYREYIDICIRMAQGETKADKDLAVWDIHRLVKGQALKNMIVIMRPYDWGNYLDYNHVAERGDLQAIKARLARETA